MLPELLALEVMHLVPFARLALTELETKMVLELEKAKRLAQLEAAGRALQLVAGCKAYLLPELV